MGSYTLEDPKRADTGVNSTVDMYAVGLFLGVIGYNSSVYQGCHNIYKYVLTNPKNKTNFRDIDIKVVATDRFNNEYTETTITEGTDYTLTKKR